MEPENRERRLKVYQMFGKTEQSVDQDVEIIKEWMQTQPHLPEVMEDVKIRNFLVLNKFSIERTKERVDMYYTIRSLIPDLYENSNPKLPKMKEIFETTYVSVHPKAVEGMYRVFFWKPKTPNSLQVLESSKLWYNIFEIALYNECVASDIIIYDMSTTTFADIKQFSLSMVTKFFTVYTKVYGLRVKALYLLNSPSFVNIFLSILKAVVKQKIFERIRVCSDAEVLREIFDHESLPKDYGGNGPTLEELNELTQEGLLKYQKRFDKLDTMRVDESLRPQKLDNDEILGFYGNFKKVEID